MNRSFESVHDAENRSRIEKEKIAKGEKLPKDHTGSFSKMTWDKAGLEDEVRHYEPNMVVNWSQLALNYGINDSKGITNIFRGHHIKFIYTVRWGYTSILCHNI